MQIKVASPWMFISLNICIILYHLYKWKNMKQFDQFQLITRVSNHLWSVEDIYLEGTQENHSDKIYGYL